MLAYYALYKKDVNQPPPVGIFILETRTNDALLWNHRQQAWQYDPSLVLRYLDDDRNWDRIEEVDRTSAARITAEITSQELPDEETIYWVFQWKGDPPANRD